MRAIRRLRMPGAAQLATGAFLVTLPLIGLVIASNSALQAERQRASRRRSKRPLPATASASPGSPPPPRSRGSWSNAARSRARVAAPSWYTASCCPARSSRGQAGRPRQRKLAHARDRPHPPRRPFRHPLPRPRRRRDPGSGQLRRRRRSPDAPRRLPARSSAYSRPSRPGITTRATRPAASTPPTGSPTRRCPAAPR